MKTIKTLPKFVIGLILLLSLTYCSDDDTIDPITDDDDGNSPPTTFSEMQSEGYESMNRLFSTFNSVFRAEIEEYNDIAYLFNSKLEPFEFHFFQPENLLYDEVFADYSNLTDGNAFVTGIHKIALKPAVYNLNTDPITITPLEEGDDRVIFQLTGQDANNVSHDYEMEMKNLPNSNKNASEQYTSYQYFTSQNYYYFQYVLCPNFFQNAWAHEGIYTIRKDGQEIVKIESEYQDHWTLEEGTDNTSRNLVSHSAKVSLLESPYCEYSFDNEAESFFIKYYNENQDFTSFNFTRLSSAEGIDLHKLFTSSQDLYHQQTSYGGVLTNQVSVFKSLPVYAMSLEGLFFPNTYMNVSIANATDELELKLDYSRIGIWPTDQILDKIPNTKVIFAVTGGKLNVDNHVWFELSRDGNDKLQAYYPDYDTTVEAAPYFNESVSPLEDAIEEKILELLFTRKK